MSISEPSDQLVREYHGCTVVSVPDTRATEKRPEGSDGWLHAVQVNNRTIGDPVESLARAIEVAKAVPEDEKQPPDENTDNPPADVDGDLVVNPD